MANNYFQFKQFIIRQDKCAMKVTTDACLFGAWIAEQVRSRESGVDSQKSDADYILDIGTGTGLLSLMLAQKNPSAVFDAIEIDKDAAEQAKDNVAASSWQDRINIVHTDAREFDSSKKYDVIISNPPFYENELKGDDKKRNLAHHSEGLLLSELLNIIKSNLEPRGSFYLVLPYKRNDEIKKLLLEHEFAVRHITFVRQSVNHDYFRIMLAGKLKNENPEETEIDELPVWNEQQQYSRTFRNLLKDYYLHL